MDKSVYATRRMCIIVGVTTIPGTRHTQKKKRWKVAGAREWLLRFVFFTYKCEGLVDILGDCHTHLNWHVTAFVLSMRKHFVSDWPAVNIEIKLVTEDKIGKLPN